MKDILLNILINLANSSMQILTSNFLLTEFLSFLIQASLMFLLEWAVSSFNLLRHKVRTKKDVEEDVKLEVYESRNRKSTREIAKQSPWEAYNQSLNVFDEVYDAGKVIRQLTNQPMDNIKDLWNVVE